MAVKWNGHAGRNDAAHDARIVLPLAGRQELDRGTEHIDDFDCTPVSAQRDVLVPYKVRHSESLFFEGKCPVNDKPAIGTGSRRKWVLRAQLSVTGTAAICEFHRCLNTPQIMP